MSAVPERPKEPKEANEAKKAKKGPPEGVRPLELNPPPAYIDHRMKIFDELKQQQDAHAAAQPRDNINVTLPNGSIKVVQAWETTPADVARELSKSLLERTVVARVNGELWDLTRPFEKDSQLELLDFDHPEGKKVFWHSSAHILGEAAERHFGCDLCIGPPVEDGFYYEMALPDGAGVTPGDWKPLEQVAQKAIKEKQPFERLTLSKEKLLEMFRSNKYKQHIINDKIPDGTSTTVYRCGPLIDLCRGPHVPHTGHIKNFKIMKSSASYFLGDAKNDSLQRIYGVSFPTKQQLAEHLAYLEEAAKRDHRKIGTQQELFFFHEWSPGSAFWLPKGTIIYNTLQAFLREEYWRRGYVEVHSPNMYSSSLWKQSGHWQHYSEDMFTLESEKDKWGLKPMNCPGHALIFGHRVRSYNELPIRMAEFGVLHRNEASGALTGLTRVRRFVQDDTHIFCREDQIEQEILGLFDFLQAVYGNFGFTFKLKLSTRPEGFLGDIETWDKAEASLAQALDNFCNQSKTKWEMNPGDGAFYGPKIDITISDALRRDFQCATIQLDFNLPRRFSLEYVTSGGSDKEEKPAAEAPKPVKEAPVTPEEAAAAKANALPETPRELTPGCARPVMIHRAIYGSFERFIGILIEHFAGKWPLWLSPRQILIVPVTASVHDYCREVEQEFRNRHFHVDCDLTGNTMQKKIRTGQLQSYNYTLVLGVQEKESRSVNIRDRDDPATQKMGDLVPLDEAITRLEKVRADKVIPKVQPIGGTASA